MDTVGMIRTVVGIAFILFGLGVYFYDKLHNMKYSEFRYSPISWFICILVGIYSAALTVQRGVIVSIVAVVLWVVTKLVVSKFNEKKSRINKIV